MKGENITSAKISTFNLTCYQSALSNLSVQLLYYFNIINFMTDQDHFY